MKVAILPSNQSANAFTGLPGVTEQRWAVEVCKPLMSRLIERGAEVKTFFAGGAGAETTDELRQMVDAAVAWQPDYMLSVHADWVGDKAKTGILMLMPRVEDAEEGQRLGKAIATRVGLPYKATWVYGQGARKIMFLRALRDHHLQGSLVEVSEFGTAAEAKWIWEHAREIGLGIADALAMCLGLGREEEEMTDEDRDLLKQAVLLAKQARISDLARSHDMEILKAMLGGESEGRVGELEIQKAHAVRLERDRLGL